MNLGRLVCSGKICPPHNIDSLSGKTLPRVFLPEHWLRVRGPVYRRSPNYQSARSSIHCSSDDTFSEAEPANLVSPERSIRSESQTSSRNMDLDRKVWIQEGPYFTRHHSRALSSFKDSMKTESSHAIMSTPFRLLDFPFEIRSEILCRAISSTKNFWLDREVITFGESLASIRYVRGRIVWRDSNSVYINLLTTSKQIYDEVQQILFSRFAFDALGWGYTMRYSDPSKTPNHLPKHRIMHIVYTPYFTKYLRERQSADLILSGLPLLSSVRILISWACAHRLVGGDTRAASRHVVAVARLFRQVGKVAVVGQSLMDELQKQLVREARKELKDEPWYRELDLDYTLYMPFLTSGVEEHL